MSGDFWGSQEGCQGRICLQCRRPGFNPWVRKIPWRRKWQPTPVFFPVKFHEQRSLAPGLPSMGSQSRTRLSPLPFGERTRDCSPGHAGKEGPQLARTGASQGFPRDEDLREPLVRRQGSQVSMRVARGPKLMCIKSVMPSGHLILCRPLLLLPLWINTQP